MFLGAALLVALTPGANNLLALQNGMRHGRWRAMVALAGRLVAFSLLIAAVVAGLGPLLAASTYALTVIKWAGVAYLAYLGVRTLLETLRGAGRAEPPAGQPAGRFALVRKEFLVAITNPKAILVFTAFVPQFLDAGRPVAGQLIELSALYLVAEATAATGYCVAGGLLRSVRMSLRARRNLDRGTGVVLLGLAGALAVEST